MIYIDFYILDLMILFVDLRKSLVLELLQVINVTFFELQQKTIDLETEANYQLVFDCRKIYVQHYLNDQHDLALRRIFIRTVNNNIDVFSYLQDEMNEDLFSYGYLEVGPDVFTYGDEELEALIDFEVVIPIGFIYDEAQLINDIDTYCLPSKQYTIVEE